MTTDGEGQLWSSTSDSTVHPLSLAAFPTFPRLLGQVGAMVGASLREPIPCNSHPILSWYKKCLNMYDVSDTVGTSNGPDVMNFLYNSSQVYIAHVPYSSNLGGFCSDLIRVGAVGIQLNEPSLISVA